MLDITYIRQNQDDIIVMLRNRLLENEYQGLPGCSNSTGSAGNWYSRPTI